jgi:hypothetical protein
MPQYTVAPNVLSSFSLTIPATGFDPLLCREAIQFGDNPTQSRGLVRGERAEQEQGEFPLLGRPDDFCHLHRRHHASPAVEDRAVAQDVQSISGL